MVNVFGMNLDIFPFPIAISSIFRSISIDLFSLLFVDAGRSGRRISPLSSSFQLSPSSLSSLLLVLQSPPALRLAGLFSPSRPTYFRVRRRYRA